MTADEVGTRDLEPILTNLLTDLLKPVRVKGLVFTKSSRDTVQGIILTSRPKGGRTLARSFEVRFAGLNSGRLTCASVEGRRLLFKGASIVASDRGDSSCSKVALRQPSRAGGIQPGFA